MSEPNVYEQLAGMTIERDAALAEGADLRELLAQCKPFLTHNGLLLRIGARGIKADPEYQRIARENR